MKITYRAQRVYCHLEARDVAGSVDPNQYFTTGILATRAGVLFVADGAMPHAVKAAIEATHPGWYAALWKAHRGNLFKDSEDSKLERAILRIRIQARRSARIADDLRRHELDRAVREPV